MVSVRKGDLVRLEYTGRVASTGQIFETTDEQLAKRIGIYEDFAAYGPKLAVFGNGSVLRGLEEAIVSAELGKQEEFVMPAGKAFGERVPALVRVVSEKEFAKQNVRPVPGMVVAVNDVAAQVKSVTSGRVVVDFNHPLAGESVKYTLKVDEVISDEGKKVEAILAVAGAKADVKKSQSGLEVEFEKGIEQQKAEQLKKLILAVAPGASFKAS